MGDPPAALATVAADRRGSVLCRSDSSAARFSPNCIAALTAGGMVFSGRHPAQPIMQILELPQESKPAPEGVEAGECPRTWHPYFMGAQFHPELTSRPLRPQPMFMGLVAAAIARRASEDPEALRALRASPEIGLWLRTPRQARQTV